MRAYVTALFQGAMVAASMAVSLAQLILPLFEDGLSMGADVPLHIGNLVESAELLNQCPPPWDWLPDIAGGYGGPNFLYYGHLSFVFPAVLVHLGFSPILAMKMLIAFTFLAGGISAFLWCSLHGDRWLAVLGCILFLQAPYFFSLPYLRGSYPEFLACAFYPMLFFLTHRWMTRPSPIFLLLSALTFTIIIGSHTLSLILVLPFWFAYALVLGRRHGIFKCGILIGSLFAAGAALAAPFLVSPALEKEKVDISRQFETANAYSETGIPWPCFLNQPTRDDQVSTHLLPGRIHLLLLLPSVLLAFRKGAPRTTAEDFFHGAAALGALVLTERSIGAQMAGVVPPLRFLQFPWRFLSFFNLFAGSAIVTGLGRWGGIKKSWKLGMVTATPLLCVYFYGRSIPPQAAKNFMTESPQGIRESLTTLDHEDKYLPRAARLPKKARGETLLEVLDSRPEVRLLSSCPNTYEFEVKADREFAARFNQYHFDGWMAEARGKSLNIIREDGMGLCRLTLPAGAYELRIHFSNTMIRKAGKLLSAATLITLSVMTLLSWKHSRKKPILAAGKSNIDSTLEMGEPN